MGDGTRENPYTREDVLEAIKENGGTAENLDLSGKVFEEGIDLSKQSLFGIILKNARLIKANLSESGLMYAHFEGAQLIGANIIKANICETHFEGANLKDAVLNFSFSSRPYIDGDLSGIAYFDGAHFEGASVKEAFLERASFEKADLATANFDKSKLGGSYFKNARLVTAYFRSAELASTDFTDAELRSAHLEGAYLNGACLEEADLRGAYLGGTFLTDANLKDAELGHAKFDKADLRFANLEGADLIGVEFTRDTKLDNVHWGNYILYRERSGEFNSAISTYRGLKMWHTEHGEYDIAGKFFYREMEAKRKAQSWKSEPFSKLWSWVIKLLCGYGENYERVVVSALVIIFCLAVVYVYGGLNLPYAIYFSAASFTALGYGSWVDTPAGWVRALGAAESFIGVFMMALFLVTFTRKMIR